MHRVARRACRLVAVAILVFSVVIVRPAVAGPASKIPFLVVQPDGTTFLARAVGDEWANATQTLDGFTIAQNPGGVWVYTDTAAGGPPVPTSLVVGRDLPVGLTPGFRRDGLQNVAAFTPSSAAAAPVLGIRRTLVILVQFANKTASTAASEWRDRFFGPSDSVADHYAVSSYNQVTIAPASESHGLANDGVVGWLTLPTTHPNTGGSTGTANQQLSKDAIAAANAFVDFASYDTNHDQRVTPDEVMVIVIAAGNETSFGGSAGACAPSVWGHRWSIFAVTAPAVDGVEVRDYAQFGEMHCSVSSAPGQIATIGIMAHEAGHLGFGLPDLYDVDYSSSGIGEWSLMAGGSWNGVNRLGDSPALLDPWSKYFLGWISPTRVTDTPTLQSVNASAHDPTVFQFLAGNAAAQIGEYFLLENRQQMSYDVALPGAGLLVWHIDESRRTNAAECIPGGFPACSFTVHYKVAVVPADNRFDLERGENRGDASDPFPGTTGRLSLTDATSPSSRLWTGVPSTAAITNISASGAIMTAVLSTGPGVAPVPFDKLTPASGAAMQDSNLTLSWAPSAGALSYLYCVDTTNDDACSTWTSTQGTSVIITGLSAVTTYYWQVQAINGWGETFANGGATAFWSFTTATTVGDPLEPDNTVGQAQLIAAGAAQSHTFHVNGDVDWARFSAVAGNVYTIVTFGLASGVDTVVYLYGPDGVTPITSNDNFGSGLASQIIYTADVSGTRYIRVVQAAGSGLGSYGLGLVLAPPPGDLFEPDNAAAQSSTIASGATQTHTFHVTGDVDWARFSAVAGRQYTISTSGLATGVDTVVYLYAADGLTVLMSNDDGGGGLASRLVYAAESSGVRYIRVVQYSGTGLGSYLLGLAEEGGLGDAYEPDNTAGQAALLITRRAQAHTFHVSGDVDWLRFSAIAGQRYVIATSGLASTVDTVAYLYAPDGVTQLAVNDDFGGGLASHIEYTATATANLYVRVVQFGRSGLGAYMVTLDGPAVGGTRSPWDFDGDGRADPSVYRPSTGTWDVRNQTPVQLGLPGDVLVPGDYDGNGRSDVAVYRPSTGMWYVRNQAPVQWGLAGDLPVPGDYDGNGVTDIAVWRPSTGTWYVLNQAPVQWGLPTDVPVPGDYDGNGTTDLAVWRSTTGTWYVRNQAPVQWGAPGDVVVPGDYDGNGTTDLAVYRPLSGTWHVRNQATVQWGLPGDIPVPGDYDGNGSIDVAVYRPAGEQWFVRNQFTVQWGSPGDIPIPRSTGQRMVKVPGDQNGDQVTDAAVYRPSTGEWFSTARALVQWGLADDIPVPADYDGNGTMDIAVWRPSTGVWYVRDQAPVLWGLPGDVPVPGDYDGNRTTDIAVWRPSTGEWYVRDQFTVQWGLSDDVPMAADYNGDGVTDVAVYRPSTGEWYVRNQFTVQWGLPEDVPIPGDYDGNGTIDVAVWRPSTGVWYVQNQFTLQWGLPGDIPIVR